MPLFYLNTDFSPKWRFLLVIPCLSADWNTVKKYSHFRPPCYPPQKPPLSWCFNARSFRYLAKYSHSKLHFFPTDRKIQTFSIHLFWFCESSFNTWLKKNTDIYRRNTATALKRPHPAWKMEIGKATRRIGSWTGGPDDVSQQRHNRRDLPVDWWVAIRGWASVGCQRDISHACDLSASGCGPHAAKGSR